MSYPASVVPFNGDNLITLDADNNHYVALKPIVEALGLSVARQREKVQSDPRWTHKTLPCQTPGGVQEMLCLPLRKLNGWLFSINPNKVRPDLKDKVIRYQEECFEVLYRYWNGEAISGQPRKQTPYDLIDLEKLSALRVQDKELAWNYLESLGIERTTKYISNFSWKDDSYDLEKLAEELKPIAREYDQDHFWVPVSDVKRILGYKRIPTLKNLLEENLLMPGEKQHTGGCRFSRHSNIFITKNAFNGKRTRIFVFNWKLLQENHEVQA